MLDACARFSVTDQRHVAHVLATPTIETGFKFEAIAETLDVRKLVSVCAISCGAVALAGCQTSKPTVVTKVVERKVEVPRSLRSCSEEPVAGTAWVSQRDIARYLVRLAEAGADCRAKLAAVKRIVDEQE